MAPARKWTETEVEQLYTALDAVSKQPFDSIDKSVKEIQQEFKKSGNGKATSVTQDQIRRKLRNLATKHHLGREEVVSQWRTHASRIRHATRPNSPQQSSKPSAKGGRTASKSSELSSDSDPPRPPTRSARGRREKLKPHDQQSPSDRENEAQDKVAPDVREVEHSGDGANTSDEVTLIHWPASMVPPFSYEISLIREWRNFRTKKCFGPKPDEVHIQHALHRVVEHIENGVKSFCEAQPVAHLTAAKLTRAAVELAQTLLQAHGRERVYQSLTTVFGDPALSASLILRAFGAAAVTVSSL